MLVAALVAVGTEIVIPLLTKSVIDGAIAHHQRRLLLPLGAAAIALGVTQAVLNLVRRWVQASAVAGMERSMRADLYAHLQRLHAGFHDEWQSGQLLSRATTDLSAIRRFAGFGTIFLITNVVTFAVVVALLIHLNWWLGLLTGSVLLPVVVVSARFERRYRVLSRRAQDQQGDLATYIEEAATGIRVLKALGRRDEAAHQHGAQANRVFQTQVSKARLRATFWALLDLIPNALIGLILLLGALATSRHELTLGGLVAFITLTLQLVWPIQATGYILASGQEAATAAQRIFEIFDTRPAITGPAGARARAPFADKHHAFEIAGWQAVRPQPRLGRPPLQRREAKDSPPVDPEQESDGSVAEPACPIVEQHWTRMAFPWIRIHIRRRQSSAVPMRPQTQKAGSPNGPPGLFQSAGPVHTRAANPQFTEIFRGLADSAFASERLRTPSFSSAPIFPASTALSCASTSSNAAPDDSRWRAVKPYGRVAASLPVIRSSPSSSVISRPSLETPGRKTFRP